MYKLLIIFLLFFKFFLSFSQEKKIERENVMKLNEEFKNSNLTNEEYQSKFHEKSNNDEDIKAYKIKSEILQIKTQTESSNQQYIPQQELEVESFIGDEKEEGKKMPSNEMPESINYDPGENPSKSDEEDHRLVGPSQYDSRIEPYKLNQTIAWQNSILEKSSSVGIIIERERITQISKEVFQIDDHEILGVRYNLCPDEAFFTQPVVGIGTAWLYDSNRMITASHVFEGNIDNYIVIFGYKILNTHGLIDVFIPKSRIFEIKKIIHKDTDLDLIAFELDRPTLEIPLEWENPPKNIGNDTEIYMIGYPTGLPLKIALNASIVENNHPNYFYTSLDSFQGNSGSPVFNYFTNKVIGVLVSGEIDYNFNGNCNESPLCKYPYCKGEKVVVLTNFFSNLHK